MILNVITKQIESKILIQNKLIINPFILINNSNKNIICLCFKSSKIIPNSKSEIYLKIMKLNTWEISDKKNILYENISVVKDNKYFFTFNKKIYGDNFRFKIIDSNLNEKEIYIKNNLFTESDITILRNIFYDDIRKKILFIIIYKVKEFIHYNRVNLLTASDINLKDLKKCEKSEIKDYKLIKKYEDNFFTYNISFYKENFENIFYMDNKLWYYYTIKYASEIKSIISNNLI